MMFSRIVFILKIILSFYKNNLISQINRYRTLNNTCLEHWSNVANCFIILLWIAAGQATITYARLLITHHEYRKQRTENKKTKRIENTNIEIIIIIWKMYIPTNYRMYQVMMSYEI